MHLLSVISDFNHLLAGPVTILFLGVALFLTFKLRFIQFRAFSRFIYLIKNNGPKQSDNSGEISPFHALFTAMSTTIGMGNVVSPSLAIMAGGPGALFWLLFYGFLASATKYAEVVFAIKTRSKTEDGHIIGGPTRYLRLIHPILANWYGLITMFLFAGWSALQSNAIAEILVEESVNEWITGIFLSVVLLLVLWGGAKRVGAFASKLVPIMFCLYVTFALFILLKDLSALKYAFTLMFSHIFKPASAAGGFLGATVFAAIKSGTYKSAFVTEAGIGTSSVPHALADTSNAKDQGILALYSMAADMFLCLVSGLLVLVTGVWMSGSELTGKLVYEAFKVHSPFFGRWILIISIFLFVLTTVIGNGFNGVQSFSSFTKHRWVKAYYVFVSLVTLLGAISPVPLVWHILEVLLSLVVVPNLIGILILSIKDFKLIKY